MSLHFDGVNEAPPLPKNGIPEEGTPAWERYLAAEQRARDVAGSGINHQRLATIEADRKAVEESRKKHGAA
jgi:hypothetical protein